jgi:hypothetical protein
MTEETSFVDNFTTKIFKIICVYLIENINTWICPRCGLSKIKKMLSLYALDGKKE